MNLSAVQPAVAAILQAAPALAGVPVVQDDGTGEATPARMTALKAEGICLLVWRVEAGQILGHSRTGTMTQELLVFVFVEENQTVCRSETGLNVRCDDVAQAVMAALSGAKVGPERIQLADPPFDNLGKVNGVNRILVNATTELTI